MEPTVCEEADRSFGPVVPSGCRGGFDFTLMFEHIFFSLVPDLILILAVSMRLWELRHARSVASRVALHLSKQCIAYCYAISQLATLVLWGIPSSFRTQVSLASAIFNVIASLSICILSYVETKRSSRPSSVLNVYLFGSSLFDIVQVRTLWLAGKYNTSLRHIAVSSSVGLALKVVLLVLEAIPKNTSASHSPSEEKSGVYSLRTFWWLNQILWLGRYKKLDSKDLFPIDSGLKTARYSSELIDAWNQGDQDDKYALLRAVFYTLRWPLLAPALPRLILIGFNYAQPLLIKRALNFVDQSGEEKNTGYGLIGATIVVFCGLAIFNGYYGHLLYRGITIVRGSLIDIIYHKSLHIELSEAQKAAPAGLVTADVERIDLTIEKMHSLWASVIEIGIGIFLLEREVGWACIAPVIVATLCTLSTFFISKVLPSRQKRWNQAIQKRVALTSTMLSNMKAVKSMSLSNYIATTLQDSRMSELAASAAFRRCMAIVNVLVMLPRQLSAPFTFMILVLAVHKGQLSASRAFTALTIIELMTTPLALFLQTIPSATTSLACLDRIQTYLKSPDRCDQRDGLENFHEPTADISITESYSPYATEKLSRIKCNLPVVSLKQASIAYKATEKCVLDSISFSVSSGCVIMIVGPIASGKSSLLKSILGELDLRTGELYVRTPRVGYCDSNPWIPNGTIRSCIVGTGELDYDGSWYDEVVHACALDEDFRSLADGSSTELGSRGIALSEGQKQRLALARAIFSRAPLLLLDDVFRSLDSRTEMLLSERLLSPSGLFKRCNLTVIFATHSTRHLPIADQIIVLDTGGRLAQIGSFQDLNAREGYVQSLAIQQLSTEPENLTRNKEDEILPQQAPSKKEPNLQAKRLIGPRDKSVYTFYVRPVGLVKIGVLLIAVVSLAFLTRFQRIWVQWWTESHSHQSMYIGIFFLLAIGACLSFAFFFWWMFMFVVPVTAGSLHEQLLHSIIRAPLSYFTTVDSGVILNRFSQDMAIINGQLPVNLFQAISIAMICLIQIAFIAYGSKYLAIAIPITLLVLWTLSHFYLLTSQQLRVLDLELKAPIYTSLTETKEGLATIRAFGWQSSYMLDCQARIDGSKTAIYLLFMIQRWLNFVLDLIVAALATVLMTLATQLRHSTNAAVLGVGISSVIGFSLNISQFIVCYTEVENSLGAISRIKDCVESIKAEDSSLDVQEAPKDWPRNGAIEFRNVTASYNHHSNPALNNVTLRVSPGQKVCLCGRTGSGKSTLISALLRLIDIQPDTIFIDNIDITTLRSESVRKSLNVIPQSPFFLPGSVRLNLSPSHPQTDSAMITSLTKAGLWDLIASRGGLDADISAVALSHGQQQLFCLATAMLKKSKIVLIDEATSGVDVETERRMCDLIREEFRDCTVLSIMHGLRMAMDCDLVVVLSGGRCVEMGEPQALLEGRGEFWRLAG